MTGLRPTFVLLKLIEICSIDIEDLLSPSVYLARDSPPEDLVKHGVGHVIVCSTLLVFWDSESVLLIRRISPVTK